MNEKDKAELAAIFEAVLAKHTPVCPHGLDRETALALKDLADSLREGKKTLRNTFYSAIAMIVVGGIILALKHIFGK